MTVAVNRLGIRENLAQFSLLILVNAFVGAMVGMERSILPAIAEQEFELAAVHAHPLPAVTATLPVVEPLATVRVVGESV